MPAFNFLVFARKIGQTSSEILRGLMAEERLEGGVHYLASWRGATGLSATSPSTAQSLTLRAFRYYPLPKPSDIDNSLSLFNTHLAFLRNALYKLSFVLPTLRFLRNRLSPRNLKSWKLVSVFKESLTLPFFKNQILMAAIRQGIEVESPPIGLCARLARIAGLVTDSPVTCASQGMTQNFYHSLSRNH
jgi:hypothetical protein